MWAVFVWTTHVVQAHWTSLFLAWMGWLWWWLTFRARG